MAVVIANGDPAVQRGVWPYQNLLRSIGAYLDEQAASQICVLEVDDDFLVRLQPRQPGTDVMSIRFGLEHLSLWDRRRRGQRSDELQVARPPARGGYQDILRAVGYELEHASARHVTLEELDGIYVLSYYAPDSGATSARKHRLILGPSETEDILRKARARRRSPSPGWLLNAATPAADPVRLVHVNAADPMFEPTPGVLFEYTVPGLTTAATTFIQEAEKAHLKGIYRAHRGVEPPRVSAEERLLQPFRAAQLITVVYVRCVDPIRFAGPDHQPVTKDQIVSSFARSLTARKVLPSLQVLAEHIDDLKSLDRYQSMLGTYIVRWLRYLATEVLSAQLPVSLPDQASLFAALVKIRDSETVADRFASIRRRTPSDHPAAG